MGNERAILLVDMDCFFASCHMALDDSLKVKPVVVASPNSRGIVLTANYVARKFGIKTGEPIFKIKNATKDLVIIPPVFKLYVDTSNKIFGHIKENFSDNIEVISIDEAYVDVTNQWKKFGSVKKMAEAIRESVSKTFNLTCSIGVSTNKFLAKMGSEMNKPNGCFTLIESNVKEKLWPLPIEKMYGVGITTKKVLNSLDIFTIGDVLKYDLDFYIKEFGKRGAVLYNNANGVGDNELNVQLDESKSISNEMTLMSSTTNVSEIEDLIYELVQLVEQRLKINFQKGKTVSIMFKYEYDYNYDGFDKRTRGKRTRHQYTLEQPTNKAEDIYSVVKNLFYEIWDERPIFFVGVSVSNLVSYVKWVEQVSFDHNFNVASNEDNLKSFINKFNTSGMGKVLMNGNEFERQYDRKKMKPNDGLSKIDDMRINEKTVREKWKK